MLNSSSFGSGLYQAAAQAQAFRNFALQHQAQMRMQSPGFYSPHQFFPGQQGVPQGPAPGSLIIHDSFERSNQQDNYSPLTKNSEHGEIVRHSAQFDGFQGRVHEREVRTRDDRGIRGIQMNSHRALSTQELTKGQAIQALRDNVGSQTEVLFDTQTRMLNEDSASGARNSVVNISMGTSKARVTERIYTDMLQGLVSKDPAKNRAGNQAMENYARAFDLDTSKLRSTDPEINGPERQKLMQGILDTTSSVFDNSPRIQNARRQFDGAVRRFEAGNNSVVIAAGNEGEVAERLAKLNNGRRLDTPKDFTQNIFENDQVTSVGATQWKYDEQGKLRESTAAYSSGSEGIDIYASGSVGFKDPNKKEVGGTSFAAPRVAAAMAELHKQNPHMSSAQIEALMKQKLTHKLPGLPQDQSDQKVLDFGKSFAFLKRQTF